MRIAWRTAFVLTLLVAGLARAHAADRPAFCNNKPKSDSVRITCSTPSLWSLVTQEISARERAYALAGRASIDKLQSNEIAWRDANCHDSTCLREWYETQVEVFEKMVAYDKATVSARAPDYAAKMTAYDRAFAGLRRQVMLAYVARSCLLRSEAWGDSIAMAYNLTRIDFERTHHFDDDEHRSADARDRAIDDQVLATNPIGMPDTCTRLRNGHTMDDLDALQRRAVGGYH